MPALTTQVSGGSRCDNTGLLLMPALTTQVSGGSRCDNTGLLLMPAMRSTANTTTHRPRTETN